MQLDPDSQAVPQAPKWRRVLDVAVGLWFVVLVFFQLRLTGSHVDVWGVVRALVAGAAAGGLIYLFDRWWGDRPKVRPVRLRGSEVRRRLPTMLVYTALTWIMFFLVFREGSLALIALGVAVAVMYATVFPRFYRRSRARAVLRKTPPRADIQ